MIPSKSGLECSEDVGIAGDLQTVRNIVLSCIMSAHDCCDTRALFCFCWHMETCAEGTGYCVSIPTTIPEMVWDVYVEAPS